jgi:hypothetical protein
MLRFFIAAALMLAAVTTSAQEWYCIGDCRNVHHEYGPPDRNGQPREWYCFGDCGNTVHQFAPSAQPRDDDDDDE